MEGRDMADLELPDGLRDDLRAAWHCYVDLLAPLRPTLHGYCSRLTGNLWDAEDLVQDTLLRAFGTLGSIFTRIENPRAYLLRTATNLWIDTVRRRGNEVTAYAAADVPGLIGLMLDTGSVENVGCSVDVGPFAPDRGWFYHAVHGHPEWPAQFAYESARLERRLFQGEPLALGFCTRRGREALEQVLRFEEQDGRIVRLRGYAFCPETMRAIGAELDLKVRTGLYRFPTPEPGKLWADVTPATTERERR